MALRERMNRLFDDSLASVRSGNRGTWSPAADVYRAEGAIVITLELPGLAAKDVTVSPTPGGVRVRGRRGALVTGANILQLERGTGTFERTFALPKGARMADRRIQFEDGVLRIAIALGEAGT